MRDNRDARSRVLMLIALAAALAATCAIVEHLTGWSNSCERCGTRLRPFLVGDPEWTGSDIYECPKCGWSVDRSFVPPNPAASK